MIIYTADGVWKVYRRADGALMVECLSSGLIEIPTYDIQSGKLTYAFPDVVPPRVKRAAQRMLSG